MKKQEQNFLISLSKASELLGVSKDTLRNWDASGKLKSIRTQGGHRRYNKSDVLNIINMHKIDGWKEKQECQQRPKDKVVVYTYVCGDILHKGHILYLRNAASLGDFLIVGVLTDEAVMEKKSKPLISFEERIEIVGCLRMVDMVVPQYEYAPHLNVRNLNPNILIESTSHSDELIQESIACMEGIGGRVIVSAYYPYQSSTEIKNKINERKKNE